MHPVHEPIAPAKIAPIVDPSAPAWVRFVTPTRPDLNLAVAVASVGVLAPFGLATWWCFLEPPFPALGVALFAIWTLAMVVGAFGAARAAAACTVSAPAYAFRGVPIDGPALDLLADIQRRFDWAERMFAQVPTGIRWAEVEDEVAVLLWEAAGHAAKVSAVDVELAGLAYADAGSPQAALRRDLRRRRDELWAALEVTQREADDLAREASNTAAAARIALSRTGGVSDLELLAPSGADLVARGTLAAARARLALLAEVWAELDETGAIADEHLSAQLDRSPDA